MDEYKIVDVSNRKGNGFNNLTGETFSKLTVLGLSPRMSGRKSFWVCECECGNKTVVRGDSLKSGGIKSCGCIKKEQDKINLTANHSHKESKTLLYIKWVAMKDRCNNRNNERNYQNYGDRGIKVCDEWEKSYTAFRDWAVANGYEEGLSVERVDVNKGYNPKNCTWIPMEDQATNRRSTIWIEWEGKTKNIKQWSDYLGINYGTLHSRYRRSKMRPPELFKPVD